MLDITLTADERASLATAAEFLADRERYYRATTLRHKTADTFARCAGAVRRVLNAKEDQK